MNFLKNLFFSKFGAALTIVAVLLILVLLVIFYPQSLALDTLWRREKVAKHLRELAERVKNNPEDTTSLDELILRAQSSYRFERNYAISTLGKLGQLAEPALPTIADALFSSNSFTCDTAAHALMNMGKVAAPAKADLIRALKEYPHDGTSLWAVEALGNIGDSSPEVLDAIRDYVSNPNNFAVQEAREVYEKLTGFPLNDMGKLSRAGSRLP